MKKLSLIFIGLMLLAVPLFSDTEDTVRNKIPDEFYSRCTEQGSTTLLKYKTPQQYKTAIVYTPFGYDQENKEKKYPVLYLMHGGGGSAASYIGPATSPNQLCWIIDNAIKAGVFEPVIIVCPNHNGTFYNELRNALIPAIDEAFNTYSDREHRIIGGFSMGSVATWSTFQHCLDIVKYYIPMCGDSWVCGQAGGKNFSDQTAIVLSKADKIDIYNDYKIFAATGTSDTAYPNLTPQIQAMKKLEGIFDYTTKDFSEGNLIYYIVPGNQHSYGHTYEYIYNALSLFLN